MPVDALLRAPARAIGTVGEDTDMDRVKFALHWRARRVKRTHGPRVFRFSMLLSSLYVAAAMPGDVETRMGRDVLDRGTAWVLRQFRPG